MFWNFAPQVSSIDILLDKEDVTLQSILDEDEVLQECKVQNRKLIDFLIKPANMYSLVNMIVEGPPADMDENVKYKYPNMACELLTADVNEITDTLIGSWPPSEVETDAKEGTKQNRYLDLLYSFLDSDPPLIPLSASFFMKVMTGLVTHRSERMVSYLKLKGDFLDRVLKHLGTSAIMDFLLKFVQQIEDKNIRAEVAQWFNSERLIHRLVGGFGPNNSAEKHHYTGQCLCDLISVYREQAAQAFEEDEKVVAEQAVAILDTLESTEIAQMLVSHILTPPLNVSVIVNCADVFETLLDKKTKDGSISDMCSLLMAPKVDPKRVALATDHVVEAILPRMGDLVLILLNPPEQAYSRMETTLGILSPPLGESRLQIVKLISYLVGITKQEVHAAIYDENVLKILLDLFHDYPWNTLLHKTVEDTVTSILVTACSFGGQDCDRSTEGGDTTHPSLLKQLLVECQLVTCILQWWRENDDIQKTPGNHRRGYMGHLTRIVNTLSDNKKTGSNSTLIEQYINDLEPQVKEDWKAFLEGPLAEVNENNKIDKFGELGSFDENRTIRIDEFDSGPSSIDENAVFPGAVQLAMTGSLQNRRASGEGKTGPRRRLSSDDEDEFKRVIADAHGPEEDEWSPPVACEEHKEDSSSSDEDDLASPVVVRQSPGSTGWTPEATLSNPPDRLGLDEDIDFDDAFEPEDSAMVQVAVDDDPWSSLGSDLCEPPVMPCDTFPVDFSQATCGASESQSSENWANFDTVFSGSTSQTSDIITSQPMIENWFSEPTAAGNSSQTRSD